MMGKNKRLKIIVSAVVYISTTTPNSKYFSISTCILFSELPNIFFGSKTLVPGQSSNDTENDPLQSAIS